jgi:glycosyltransferase involved in cell wall biosynthesis
MKPRLLVLTSTFPRWQDDTDPPFVYNLVKRLTEHYDVIVHAPHFPGADRQEIIDDIHVHRFRYFIRPFEKLAGSTGILPTLRHNKLYLGVVPFFLVAQFFSLLLLVHKMRPDVIHAHWLIPQGFFAVLVKMLFGVPVVVTAHGADVFGLQHNLFKYIKQFIVTRADNVTVVSKALQSTLAEILPPGIAIRIIPMGVDCEIFVPTAKNIAVREKYGIDELFLLYVGRLTEKKGVGYLIEAMPLILKSIPHTKLMIIGRGELDKHLHAQINALALEKHIHCIGSIPNSALPAYYATADIFIGPSIKAEGGDAEGFGLTFVEAAMSGCLVIATRTGGLEDIIKENETGLFAPEKDHTALAQKIIYAFEHPEITKKLKTAGRNRCIERYDWTVIAEQYRKILDKLVAMNQTAE